MQVAHWKGSEGHPNQEAVFRGELRQRRMYDSEFFRGVIREKCVDPPDRPRWQPHTFIYEIEKLERKKIHSKSN